VKGEYGINILNGQNEAPDLDNYAAVILAVSHEKFKALDVQTGDQRVVYDVKGFLKKDQVDKRL